MTTLSETELMGRFIGKEHPPGVLIGFLLRIRKDNSRKANLTPIALAEWVNVNPVGFPQAVTQFPDCVSRTIQK